MDNKVRRPVRFADFLFIAAELQFNVLQSVTVFAESVMELALYNANRETELNQAWEDFAQDLETIQENTDGD